MSILGGKEKWMFSEMNQNLKIVRPKIGAVRPRLLFANTKATIDIHVWPFLDCLSLALALL